MNFDQLPPKAGIYNVSYKSIRTLMPIFREFDGVSWLEPPIDEGAENLASEMTWYPNEAL